MPAIVAIADREEILRRDGREIDILVARAEVTITHARYPAGERVAGAHVHHGHTDAFYVLEGELTFEVGREREELSVSAGAGITRANLDGSGVDPGFIDDAPEAHEVAVDANHVYWTGANSIGRANRDGTDVNQSLLAVPGSPSSIAVDATSKPVPPDTTPRADITAPRPRSPRAHGRRPSRPRPGSSSAPTIPARPSSASSTQEVLQGMHGSEDGHAPRRGQAQVPGPGGRRGGQP